MERLAYSSFPNFSKTKTSTTKCLYVLGNIGKLYFDLMPFALSSLETPNLQFEVSDQVILQNPKLYTFDTYLN